MARTEIVVQNVNPNAGNTPTFGNADATNDMMFFNDGETMLYVKTTTTAISLTVVSVPDPIFGRTGDVVISIPASTERMIGLLRPELFNQKGTDINKTYLNFDVSTGVTIGAFRIKN